MSVGVNQSPYRPAEQAAWLLEADPEPEVHPLGLARAVLLCCLLDVAIGVGVIFGWLIGAGR